MKLNFLILLFCLAMIAMNLMNGQVRHAFQRDALAEPLAESLGIDIDTLWPPLEKQLYETNTRYAFFASLPYAFIAIVLLLNMIISIKANR